MSKATLEINGKKITLELTDEQIKQLTGADEGRFKPEYKDNYYFVRAEGNADSYRWADDDADKYIYSQRNVFKTEEEAEKELERLKSLAILRDDARDWVPDWNDRGQTKVYVYYDHLSGVLGVTSTVMAEDLGGIYFETAALAQKSIKDHKEHWLRVFGVEG